MANLQRELQDLQAVEIRIQNAERLVGLIEGTLAREKLAGADVAAAKSRLDATRKALEELRNQRTFLAQTIEDLKAGRLPST